jgi:hypothetical protein
MRGLIERSKTVPRFMNYPIKKNMTLPVKVRKTYYTSRPGQERMAFDQGRGHLAARLVDDALKCRAGDAHAVGCLGLGQAFEVGQAQGFQLLAQQGDTAQTIQRHASRFVDGWPGCLRQGAPFARTGHA